MMFPNVPNDATEHEVVRYAYNGDDVTVRATPNGAWITINGKPFFLCAPELAVTFEAMQACRRNHDRKELGLDDEAV